MVRFDLIARKLVDGAAEGGLAFFHFSGHGRQVFDQSGDEADRWDESLMPFDSPSQASAGVDVLDDELSERLETIREKDPGTDERYRKPKKAG